MRLTTITARDVQPVKYFSVGNLSDVVVLAGPNGVGKTRLITALVNAFQQPANNAQVTLTIEATSQLEEQEWGKRVLDTTNHPDASKLVQTLQKSKRRANWQSSVLNFESDRSIQQINAFAPSWDFEDPYLEQVNWNFGLGGLRGRFQDTLHSIFRKVRSRREEIAKRAEHLFSKSSLKEPITLDPKEFPDPLEPFKAAFRQLLAPKELLDADPKLQQLQYSFQGSTFPVSSLSSGEREVVNIVFDFLLRSPSNCIVIFDEPELHLHPELSYKLLQTLRTVGINNQFILCTHSPDIITASLDNSVVFVSPAKGDGANQAVTVREEDETHQALKLLGQSIGIVALGKKIVLIEGTHSSLDKQTYGSILRGRFANLVLVPGGGKGLLTSFEYLHRQVLGRTVWGVEFYMLCDRDAVPASRAKEITSGSSQGRIEVLKRYHLENYFLDEDVLAAALSKLEPDKSSLGSPNEIRSRLKEIAKRQASYAAALAAAAYFRESVGNVDLMVGNCNGKSAAELALAIKERSKAERCRVVDILDDNKIEEFVQQFLQEIESSLSGDTDLWKQVIPGKQILNIFASSIGLSATRLKTMFIREAISRPVSPFEELFAIFERFDRN
jgi:ABC-type cobalamin/Fe3+-siderophores transport system ATPase subunit